MFKENVGAVAFGSHKGVIVFDGGIEVAVVWRVAFGSREVLADTASTVDERLVEAAVVRLVGGGVAEVPFTKDASSVAGCFEHLGLW